MNMKHLGRLLCLTLALLLCLTGLTSFASAEGEKITLRVVDWSDSTKLQREEFHKKFMEENPNVTIEYTLLTSDQFKNTVLTAINSGDAPDLFPVPSGMKLNMAVKENWFAPLTDCVTPEFLAKINPNAMLEGYQKVNDVLYVLPENIGLPSCFLYYNTDILEQAGVNPAEVKTYAKFREACKKITETGAGAYYGMIEGGNQLGRWEIIARGWSSMAGGKTGRMAIPAMLDGRAIFDRPEMIGVVELFKDIAEDGSFHPDTLNISAPEARAMFAQGQAGFLVQGIWCVATWERDNKDLHFGVMPVPTPEETVRGSIPAEIPGSWLGISANSKNKEMAGKYYMALYDEFYQGAAVSGGGFVSVVDEYNTKYMPEGATKAYYDVAMSQIKLAPDVVTADPKVNDFYGVVKDVQPSISAIMQGAVAGAIADIPAALKELADNSTVEWTRAAQEVGLDISAFEFKNWDPTVDYTPDMYGGRK